MQAIDLNYFGHLTALQSDVRLIGEWKYQKVDTATYYDANSTPFTFDNSPSTYYMAGTIRPAHVHNVFIHNLELAARYSQVQNSRRSTMGRRG